MRPEIYNGVCNQLTRAVEGRLAAAQRFDKVCATIVAEKFVLLCAHGANLSATRRIHGCKFGGYDMWCRHRVGGRRGFGGKESRDEVFLEGSRALVWDRTREVNISEKNLPRWAGHICYCMLQSLVGVVQVVFRQVTNATDIR
jgi:hypothetical protein